MKIKLPLIANWGEDITNDAPAAISEEEVMGNILGIVLLAEAKQLKLIFDDPQDARTRPYGVTRNNECMTVPILPDKFQASSIESQ